MCDSGSVRGDFDMFCYQETTAAAGGNGFEQSKNQIEFKNYITSRVK